MNDDWMRFNWYDDIIWSDLEWKLCNYDSANLIRLSNHRVCPGEGERLNEIYSDNFGK